MGIMVNIGLTVGSLWTLISVLTVTFFMAVYHVIIMDSYGDFFLYFGGVSKIGHAIYYLIDYFILFETLLLGGHGAILLMCCPFSLISWLSSLKM